ncbi:MAG TPA: MarR family transcriptional regulator [Solirubrobacteraceae bacterium]|jgi:DNA-binding MarR family transcriptional regulator
MQASFSAAQPTHSAVEAGSTDALAEQLLALWRYLLTHGGAESYSILDKLELTLTQVKALHALADHELTVKDVAEKLGLSLPGASRAVDVLVERELLTRREDPSDRRMKRLGCTPAGRDALARLDESRLAGLESFTAALPAAQRKRLAAALRPILDDLHQEQDR